MIPADEPARRKRHRTPSSQSEQGNSEPSRARNSNSISSEDHIVTGSYVNDDRDASPASSHATKAANSSTSTGDSAPSIVQRKNASASFRNVSACNRCRARKNKCDQDLPACKGCAQSGTRCIGIDPFLEKQVPRSYVYYLETRTIYLEKVLAAHSIDYTSPEDFAAVQGEDEDHPIPHNGSIFIEELERHKTAAETPRGPIPIKPPSKASRNQKQTASITPQPPQDVTPRTTQRSTPSFSRVFFAAVKSSVPKAVKDGPGRKSSLGLHPSTAEENETSMRDSVFSIDTKPNIAPAPFPDKNRAEELADLYFEHSNPQIPILHREEFKRMFDDSYDQRVDQRSDRQLYLLNMVFAIGAGIILDSNTDADKTESAQWTTNKAKKARRPGRQYQPEEYHAAAVMHFPGLLCAAKARSDGSGRGLEELQAILLMAAFALLRPVAPGLWYIVSPMTVTRVELHSQHMPSCR